MRGEKNKEGKEKKIIKYFVSLYFLINIFIFYNFNTTNLT